MRGVFVATVYGSGIAAGTLIVFYLNGPWRLLGILTVGVCSMIATTGFVVSVFLHIFGHVVIFLCVYLVVRLVMRTFPPLSSWVEGLSELPASRDEFKGLREEFDLGVAKWSNQYDFLLQVDRIYKVAESEKRVGRTSEGRRLFHGTPRENAQGIVADGFRLPGHHGMFGKGVYFADCPLKSWQYTDGWGFFGRSGIILVCWVELGRTSHEKGARPWLSRPPHRSPWQWLRGEGRYTSVSGDDQTEGGALRVPEYIVYDPSKVEVEYVIETHKVPRGAPTTLESWLG
mmetsp:Transcript_180670/g.573365  ORF Transcript_180670/g.573365 Transcript_180670/m.573365 type:complete len:287 (+) Transcript_180670:500-1360(+)